MKKKTFDELNQLETKYYELVWFARKEPFDSLAWLKEPDHVRETVFNCMKDVIDRMPKETADIAGQNGDWHHGFNSGMLAAIRFALTAEYESIEQAREEFPMLDT